MSLPCQSRVLFGLDLWLNTSCLEVDFVIDGAMNACNLLWLISLFQYMTGDTEAHTEGMAVF